MPPKTRASSSDLYHEVPDVSGVYFQAESVPGLRVRHWANTDDLHNTSALTKQYHPHNPELLEIANNEPTFDAKDRKGLNAYGVLVLKEEVKGAVIVSVADEHGDAAKYTVIQPRYTGDEVGRSDDDGECVEEEGGDEDEQQDDGSDQEATESKSTYHHLNRIPNVHTYLYGRRAGSSGSRKDRCFITVGHSEDENVTYVSAVRRYNTTKSAVFTKTSRVQTYPSPDADPEFEGHTFRFINCGKAFEHYTKSTNPKYAQEHVRDLEVEVIIAKSTADAGDVLSEEQRQAQHNRADITGFQNRLAQIINAGPGSHAKLDTKQNPDIPIERIPGKRAKR